jgi:hypothetical protein
MAKRYETTDGRYVAVAVGEWWDTTGTVSSTASAS